MAVKRRVKKAVSSKTKKQKLVLGIDLGGTTVTILILNTSGKIIGLKKILTMAAKGPEYVLKNIALNAKELVEHSGYKMKNIWRVGMGSPGPLDSKKGIIINPVNLPGWKIVKMKSILEKHLKVPVAVDNDANCAVYAEKWCGAAKRSANVVGLTLGTGIGGGIIADNKLIRGSNYNAGEIGHISLNPSGIVCNCGAKGCFEKYASATAIAQMAKNRIKSGKRSVLLKMAGGKINNITSKMVYDALLMKDKVAADTWDEFIGYLGAGVANVLNFMNPEIVVIGGGVVNAGAKLFKPLLNEVKKQSLPTVFAAAKIVPAALGEEAGAIGAAGLAIFEGDYYGL